MQRCKNWQKTLFLSSKIIMQHASTAAPHLEVGRMGREMSIKLLPNDVLEHHIFKCFDFSYWLKRFALVCKGWKQICEKSQIYPKMISVAAAGRGNIDKVLQIISKYQPTTLKMPGTIIWPTFELRKIIDESKRLDTLILREWRDFPTPLENVTTLVILHHANLSDELFATFPKLRRLALLKAHRYTSLAVKDYRSLERLVVSYYSELEYDKKDLLKIPIKSVELICINSKRTKVEGRELSTIPSEEMNYEEYFRCYGRTKLYDALGKQDFVKAYQLLESETTYENEIEVQNSPQEFPYIPRKATENFSMLVKSPKSFPKGRPGGSNEDYSRNGYKDIALSHHFGNLITDNFGPSEEATFKQFVVRKKLKIDPEYQLFVECVNHNWVQKSLEEFQKLGKRHLQLEQVHDAFFKLIISPEVFSKDLLEPRIFKRAKILVNAKSFSLRNVQHIEQFQTLQLFRKDWSQLVVSGKSEHVFQAMIAKGCHVSMKQFAFNPALAAVAISARPSLLFDILKAHPHMLGPMRASPVGLEKDGQSLFNAWVARYHQNRKFLRRIHKKYQLRDHMDSNGDTPLTSLIKVITSRTSDRLIMAPWFAFYNLLNAGTDPNKHRGDSLSPLALLMTNPGKPIKRFIRLLVGYGADVNAPCQFRHRMCSPLMIAILLRQPITTILYLVELGARTDYEDETGRSVLDCAREYGDSLELQLSNAN